MRLRVETEKVASLTVELQQLYDKLGNMQEVDVDQFKA